ncbi:hypothetical protein [Vitiosangium sp. GDMCC 1.1324]|uniref:hypothetical protein n=1 Tax=Vitiosangium sp. (strain GDMCC 1.1324) TaxID=2138576 RepID=UPI000D34499E|nr:hypothetical protein [Vitiosangium sp. GDMCC 1.1324]PTL81872.1 hypothetical protein DAT35_22125 [Vitiosangium sp. GDMCC 1.1324]
MRSTRILSAVALFSLGVCGAACGSKDGDTDSDTNTGEDGTGGDGSTGGDTGGSTGGDTGDGTGSTDELARFSFFVTSLEAMRELSGSQNGFGGDLRFGEATGLEGADKICRTIAEKALPGAGQKVWRAFLSAAKASPTGGPVNAIDRIGEGPWYDRNGRLVAQNKAGLSSARPSGDAQIKNDLPNERGEPNHQGVDNHDVLTGSNKQGQFSGSGMGSTCNDWTSSVGSTGKPYCGHSWPRSATNPTNGGQWLSDHQVPGCAPGVNLSQTGPGDGTASVGGGGGYGGIYCFAINP